jgi:Short C-terminal domain
VHAWWPSELGVPSSTGAQNSIRYACFPATRRLAIQIDGRVTVYDTLDHQIAGFSQQQSGDASLTFTSQHGLVRVADLPVVPTGRAGPPSTRAGAETPASMAAASAQPSLIAPAAPTSSPQPAGPPVAGATGSADEIFSKIERLAELRQKGTLTEEEFVAKKTELLSRL